MGGLDQNVIRYIWAIIYDEVFLTVAYPRRFYILFLYLLQRGQKVIKVSKIQNSNNLKIRSQKANHFFSSDFPHSYNYPRKILGTTIEK